ncbi:MFS transporter [Bacteriovorax sp. PP10]|uniref:MFS transporter n=1 Tax=Bacteriovorax antarcticus TaxID=3088717 RepID=A0ABU5VU30_9BACT|nr:MFS transporter [Bacteriovorax sp. PP10]MEA9355155.1 MFS transporter [Bacteriovorax sp. PP10]
MGQDTDSVGWGQFLKGKNKYSSIALAGGVGLHAIDVYITISILPTIVKDIGGIQYYSLNTVLYIVASILGSALSSKLLAKSSPKKAFNTALLFFGTGSLLCCLAPSMIIMLIGRTIQGFGGGLLFALAYAMIRLLFEPKLWPRAMALISAMWGVATLTGPAIGGLFAEFGVWRAAFGSVVVLTVLYSFLTNIVLKKFDQENTSGVSSKIPFVRLILLVLSVLTVSISSLDENPTKNILGILICALLFGTLAFLERGPSASRVLPTNSFKLGSPIFTIYAAMAFLVIGMQSEVFIPLFLQKIHLQTPFASGYIAALMAAGWSIASMFFSGLTKKEDISRIVLASPLIMLFGSITLSYFLPHATSSLIFIGAGLLFLGFGIGMGYPYLVTRLFMAIPEEEKELASASVTTSQLFFTSLGAALAGAIVNFNGISHAQTIEEYSYISKTLLFGFCLFPIVAIFFNYIVSKRINNEPV